MTPDSTQPRSTRKTTGTPTSTRRPQDSSKSVPHGSYKRYYRRRLNGAHPITDDRLPHLLNALSSYCSAKILDIGCNDGLITAQLARMKSACSFTGIDLDPSLIARARRVNKKRVQEEVARLKELRNQVQTFVPLSCRVVQGSRLSSTSIPSATDSPAVSRQGNLTSGPPFHENFPFNILYRCEDIVAENPGRIARQVAEYDVILCLSVTKWVHMHSGDVGLKRLFHRMFALLKPGGILILEPQPVHSYKLARQRGVEGAHRSFKNDLKLKPVQFPSYLTSEKVGFDRFEMLRGKQGKGKRFNRPLYVFHKKDDRKDRKTVVDQLLEQILEEAICGTSAGLAQEAAEIIGSVLGEETTGKRDAIIDDSIVREEQSQRGVKRKQSSHLTDKEPDGGGGPKCPRGDAVSQIALPDSDTHDVTDALMGDDKGEDVATEDGKKEDAERDSGRGGANCSAGEQQRGGQAEELEVIEVIDLVAEASSDDPELVCANRTPKGN